MDWSSGVKLGETDLVLLCILESFCGTDWEVIFDKISYFFFQFV